MKASTSISLAVVGIFATFVSSAPTVTSNNGANSFGTMCTSTDLMNCHPIEGVQNSCTSLTEENGLYAWNDNIRSLHILPLRSCLFYNTWDCVGPSDQFNGGTDFSGTSYNATHSGVYSSFKCILGH